MEMKTETGEWAFEQGNVYYRSGEYANALRYHLHSAQLEPGNVQFLCAVARSYRALGRGQEAFDWCLRALRIEPGYDYARKFMRALGYDPDKLMPAPVPSDPSPPAPSRLAAQRTNEVRTITPPILSSTGWLHISRLLMDGYNAYRQRRSMDVVASCNAVLQEDPDNSYAYYLRGAAYEAESDYRRAQEDYQAARLLGRNQGRIVQRLNRVSMAASQ